MDYSTGNLIDSAQGRSQPTGNDFNEREDNAGKQGKPDTNRHAVIGFP